MTLSGNATGRADREPARAAVPGPTLAANHAVIRATVVASMTVALCGGWLSPAPAEARQGAIAPPANLSVSPAGDGVVLFTWSAADGPEPAIYLLEGGLEPGQVLASIPVPGESNTFSFAVPPVAFYARLVAVDAAGLRSAPSNEIFVVEGTRPPGAPVDFTGSASGTTIELSWRQGPGGPPERFVLEVSGALSASIAIPVSSQITFAGVPPGTYTVSLRAENAFGASAQTPPLVLTSASWTIQVVRSPNRTPEQPILPVRYEDYLVPRLREFASREQLQQVVAGATSEFDGILRLKDWVGAQFVDGNPNPYPPWDAMIILDWIRGGITEGFCAQYAQVFLQALAAFGVPARYVEVGRENNPYIHFTTEVWSNDYGKWVMVDADFNVYFADRGVPLSALEIHDAYVSGRARDLTVIAGEQGPGRASTRDWPLATAELYYYVRYPLNARHLSAPHDAPFDRYNDAIEWLDGRTVPWEWSDVESEYPKERLTLVSTDDAVYVDGAVNAVWLDAAVVGPDAIDVTPRHAMASFRNYEYRLVDASGQAGAWQAHGTGAIRVRDLRGPTVLEVRAVNVMGRTGPSSALSFALP